MSTIKLTFKKALKVVVIVLIGMAVLGYFVGKDKEKLNSGNVNQKVPPNDSSNKNEVAEGSQNTPTGSKKIPGIQPEDVYLNFEKIGYTTEKKINTEASYFYSTFSENGIDYNVTIYCDNNVTDVSEIDLQATRSLPQYNHVQDMKPFLKYGCSIPFEGADIIKINSFIDKFYSKNNSSIIISDVKFTIFAPTQFARLIKIEKNL